MSKRIVLLQALTASISNLSLLLAGISPKLFNYRAAPDAWSVADALSHLIAVEAHHLRRLQRVLHENRPFLPTIQPNPITHNLQASPTDLLRLFETVRQKTLVFLKDVADDEWQRTAVHEIQGEVTFQFLVQYLVDHDCEHLNQIVAIQQKLNALPDRDAQPAISE